MPNIIHINEPGYSRIKFINLLVETEEMKWKILEFHNQKFILDAKKRSEISSERMV